MGSEMLPGMFSSFLKNGPYIVVLNRCFCHSKWLLVRSRGVMVMMVVCVCLDVMMVMDWLAWAGVR